jgi:hypothetical protein
MSRIYIYHWTCWICHFQSIFILLYVWFAFSPEYVRGMKQKIRTSRNKISMQIPVTGTRCTIVWAIPRNYIYSLKQSLLFYVHVNVKNVYLSLNMLNMSLSKNFYIFARISEITLGVPSRHSRAILLSFDSFRYNRDPSMKNTESIGWLYVWFTFSPEYVRGMKQKIRTSRNKTQVQRQRRLSLLRSMMTYHTKPAKTRNKESFSPVGPVYIRG